MNRNNKVVFSFSFIIIVTLVLLGIVTIKFAGSLKEENTVSNSKKLYGTVLETGNNYVKVKGLDNYDYMIISDENYEVGDFVLVDYDKDISNAKVEIIMNNEEINKITTTTTTTTTQKTTTIEYTTGTYRFLTSSSTTKKPTTTKLTKVTTTKKVLSDDEFVASISEDYNQISTYSNDSSFKEKAKDKFITLVDFIFYGKEINGRTWNSLTTSAKAKVIYYTLLIDNKIDSKWPGYKDTLKSKYSDIKSKLICEYLELTTSICKDNEDKCELVKEDFASLKSSLNITWTVLKGAFKYAYDTGVTHLTEWYEVFSGKR